jgi:hypothetical protein
MSEDTHIYNATGNARIDAANDMHHDFMKKIEQGFAHRKALFDKTETQAQRIAELEGALLIAKRALGRGLGLEYQAIDGCQLEHTESEISASQAKVLGTITHMEIAIEAAKKALGESNE